MKKKLLTAAATAAAAAASAAAYLYAEQNIIDPTHRRVYSDIDTPLRMLCLSDLHGKQFGKNGELLIRKAESMAPDLIVFPGDTLSADLHNLTPTLDLLKRLCQIAPCFLIPGNHEKRSGQWDDLKMLLEQHGVTVLQNSRWDGVINGVPVHILGLDEGIAVSKLDYLRAAVGTLEYPMNEPLLEQLCESDGAKIVLSHFPECFEKGGYCRFKFDLMISGHAHGGHFRLNEKVGVLAPGQGLFPKFCQGLYGSRPRLLVCRGLGNDSILPRINNRPEMALITLERDRRHLIEMPK